MLNDTNELNDLNDFCHPEPREITRNKLREGSRIFNHESCIIYPASKSLLGGLDLMEFTLPGN